MTIENVFCETCNCKRDATEENGEFICPACRTKFPLRLLTSPFLTALHMETVQLGSDWIAMQVNEFAPEDEADIIEADDIDCDVEEVSDDEDDWEEAFFEDESIDDEYKSAYCLQSAFDASIVENDRQKALDYLENAIALDEENLTAWLYKGLLSAEDLSNGQIESSEAGSVDTIALRAGDQVGYDPDFFMTLQNNRFFAGFKMLVSCLISAIQSADSQGTCEKVFGIASRFVELIEVGRRETMLKNLKALPTSAYLNKYLDNLRLIFTAQAELYATTMDRLKTLGVDVSGDFELDVNCSAVAPDWDMQLKRLECATAGDIWNENKKVAEVLEKINIELEHW